MSETTTQDILDHLTARASQFGPDLWDSEASICDHFVGQADLPRLRPQIVHRHELDDADDGQDHHGDVTGIHPPYSREVPDRAGEHKIRDQVKALLQELVDQGRLEVRHNDYGHASYHVVA